MGFRGSRVAYFQTKPYLDVLPSGMGMRLTNNFKLIFYGNMAEILGYIPPESGINLPIAFLICKKYQKMIIQGSLIQG